MMAGGDEGGGTGSARRRRERRLRSISRDGSGRGTPPLLRDHTFEARHEGGGGCQERRLTRPEDSHQSQRGRSPRGAPSPTGTDATSPLLISQVSQRLMKNRLYTKHPKATFAKFGPEFDEKPKEKANI